MEAVPVRLPTSLATAIKQISEREGFDRSTTLRRLVAAGLERYVAELYRRGEISLREAAQWLDVPVRVALDRLAEAGAAGNLTMGDVRASLDLLRDL